MQRQLYKKTDARAEPTRLTLQLLRTKLHAKAQLGRIYFFTSINIKAATATDEARCVM